VDVYSLHGITLGVEQQGEIAGFDLSGLLADLSFVRAPSATRTAGFQLAVSAPERSAAPPKSAREVFRYDGLRGLADAEGFYLTLGPSLFRVGARQAQVTLTPEFFDNSSLLQQQFWAFGVLRLLRPMGVFGLHAAGVVSPAGTGVLVVGSSGSGKSTLTVDLINQGWAYVGDDAVLLREKGGQVEVLALRKPFSMAEHKELDRFGPGPSKKQKSRIDMREVYPDQFVPVFVPNVILYPEITGRPESRLLPLDAAPALQRLLEQSGPQFFVRATMDRHMDVLSRLVRQCAHYELHSGLDLYRNPVKLISLLAAVEQGKADGSDHRRAHQSL